MKIDRMMNDLSGEFTADDQQLLTRSLLEDASTRPLTVVQNRTEWLKK